jgi:hypothetical protein
MKCRYCNIALAPLRTLANGEFCSDEHRVAYNELTGDEAVSAPVLEGGLVPLNTKFENVIGQTPAPPSAHPTPLEFRPKTMAAPAFCTATETHDTKRWFALQARLLALKLGAQLFNTPSGRIAHCMGEPKFPATPALPGAYVEPPIVGGHAEWSACEDEAAVEAEASQQSRSQHLALEVARSWHWLVDVWRKAPSELRIMTVLLPVLLGFAVSPSMPKVKLPSAASSRVQMAGSTVQKMVADHWNTLNKNILDRAAIAYTDDFRSGLDGWESRSNLTTRWSYDASGFVQPGPLAVFRPTVELTDYRFEFLGEIDQKGMGCAFRASNLDNYYAVKFLVVRPGPLPEVHVVRYAVIGGKEGPRVEKPLPFIVRADMLYRIRVDVSGSDFAIRAQDQIVDFWTDDRIPRGGVGLFCGRGEKARVRWLEVSHQYDTLGRLCAYLAPYGFEGRNGNLN